MRTKDPAHEKVKITVFGDAVYFGRYVITNVLDEYASFLFSEYSALKIDSYIMVPRSVKP
jgi:hypothetical protein